MSTQPVTKNTSAPVTPHSQDTGAAAAGGTTAGGNGAGSGNSATHASQATVISAQKAAAPPSMEGVTAEKHASMELHRNILLDDAEARYAAGIGAKDPKEYAEIKAEIETRDLRHLFDDAGNRLDEKQKIIDASPEAIQKNIAETRQIHNVPEKPLPKGPVKATWGESFSKAKNSIAKRIHDNYHSDSPGQMMFTQCTTLMGGMIMVDGLMGILAPKKVSVIQEDGTVTEKRSHSVKRELTELALGAGAVGAGLLINIEGKGRS
jgi:hypothetical protein